MENEGLKFNKFLELNPYSGSRYPIDVFYVPDKCVRGNKTPKTRFLVPEWLSGKPDIYTTPNALSAILSKNGFNRQIYYDIMILGITSINDRPKCPVEGTELPFISITAGYRKYSSIKAFSKSLGMDFPESIERNKKVALAKIGNKYNLGRKISEETRSNMSKAQKGHPVSDIARKHMSEAHRGKPGSRTGIPHSDVTRKRLSEIALDRMKNNPEWFEKFMKSGNQKTNKGYYLSDKYLGNKKTGKWYFYMSSFEFITLEYCDKDENVISVNKCETISYMFNGESKRYYPDILINFATGDKAIIELKPEYRTKQDINIAKFNAAIKWCKENGYYYSIITENEIKRIKDDNFNLLEFVKQGVRY